MSKIPMPTLRLRQQCRKLLFQISEIHNIPPALIVAHNRRYEVCDARQQLVVAMVEEVGLPRYVVAMSIGRHPRRIRAEVLNGHERTERRVREESKRALAGCR